jgi:hypothetical protein
VGAALEVARTSVQRLLLVAAALTLLGHGGLELGPRLVAAGASASPAVSPGSLVRTTSRPAAESKPVAPASTLRTALAVVAPAAGGETAAGPGSVPLVAPHLLSRPVVRPPTRSYVLGVGGGASGRAPPAPAGT